MTRILAAGAARRWGSRRPVGRRPTRTHTRSWAREHRDLPRATAALAYGFVVAAYLLDFVGGLLQLPEAILELSPFRHMTAVPAVDVAAGPAAIMLTVGLAGVVAGVLTFRRRDLQEA